MVAGALGKAIGVVLVGLFFTWLFSRIDRKDAEDATRQDAEDAARNEDDTQQ